MTLQELSQYYRLQKQLERDREMLSSLKAAIHPGAQVLTGMPHTPGARDKVGDMAAEIADLQAEISELEKELPRVEQTVSACINAIPDVQTRMIFRLRFLRCLTWGEVAAVIGGRNTEKGVKCACYRYIKSCSGVRRDEP